MRFLELLEGYEILELARTGITGLQRGIKDVTVIDQEGKHQHIIIIYYNGQTVTHFNQTLNRDEPGGRATPCLRK